MKPTKNVASKICLIGDGGVGKTSLIERYVHNRFDDKYLQTLGTKVSRKEVLFDCYNSNTQVRMNALIWDIMGQKAFTNLLRDAYFHGANGLIAVCDLTERKTLESLNEWIDEVSAVVGKIPTVILANKKDLSDEQEFGVKELRYLAEAIEAPILLTSAKTGENVNEAFLEICRLVVKRQMNLT